MSIAQSPSVGSEGFGSSPVSVFYFLSHVNALWCYLNYQIVIC